MNYENHTQIDNFNFISGLLFFVTLYILPEFRDIYELSNKYNLYYYELISYIYSTIHAFGMSIISVLYLFGYIEDNIFLIALHYSGAYFTVDIIYTILYHIVESAYIQEQINKLLRYRKTDIFAKNNMYKELTQLRANNNKLYWRTLGYIVHHISAIVGYLIIIYELNIFNNSITLNTGNILNIRSQNMELLFEKYIIARLLLSEITTPILNICWFLKQIKLDNTQNMINMLVLLIVLYTSFRIINFTQIFSILIINMYLLQSFMFLPLFYLNFYWFNKLCSIVIDKIDF